MYQGHLPLTLTVTLSSGIQVYFIAITRDILFHKDIIVFSSILAKFAIPFCSAPIILIDSLVAVCQSIFIPQKDFVTH